MSDPTFPMCPACRIADVEVLMARDLRADCPHCGESLVESLRTCCVPDCGRTLPVTCELPVCRDCGVKIAAAHFHEAASYDAVLAERSRTRKAWDEERRQGRTAESFVYYARLADDQIKIGFTTNIKARLAALRLDHDALLAIEPGGRDLEKRRHAEFTSDRIRRHREDFTPSDRLLGWIEALRTEHPLPRWATLPVTERVTRRFK